MSHKHTLWNTTAPYGPFYCDREDWTVCNEHKHLTLRQPSLAFNVTVPDTVSESDGLSLSEYSAAAKTNEVARWSIDPKDLDESLAKARKIIDRGNRKGLDGGFTVDVDYTNGYPELVVTGTPFHKEGWEFLASIERLPNGEAITKQSPFYEGTEKISDELLNDPTLCEHCNKKRHRRVQVIIEKGDKRMVVGSTCMKDFLGWEYSPTFSLDPEEMIDDMRGATFSREYRTEDMLSVALAMRDAYGFITVSQARESEGTQMSTRERVQMYLNEPIHLRDKTIENMLKEKDYSAEVAEIRATVEEETKNAETDYLRNMKAAYTGDYTFDSTVGLVISGVAMNERRKVKAATPKEKVSDTIFAPTGSRITVKAKLTGQNSFETAYGFTTIYTFVGEGHKFKWFASSNQNLETGNEYIITGTVKDLSNYKDEASTLLTRCKITE